MSFLRSVAVLVSGTALGHGITAAALPVLSRLYTPADFSLLAVFAGMVSIISVAACLRFDVAIAIPESESDAIHLLVLALGIATIVAAILMAIVFIAPGPIALMLNQPNLKQYLWLIPFSVILAGGYSALQMWFVRQKRFSLIARSRIAQSAGAAGVQIGTGTIAIGPAGLLFGHAMNTGAACIILGYSFLKEKTHRVSISKLTWRSLKDTFHRFGNFPKFSTWEALCNSASIQLPILLIAGVAAPQEAGYLTMAIYVMQAPMALIGAAVGQVYLSRAAKEHRDGNLSTFTIDVIGGLIKTGAGPLLAVGIISPVAFGHVFGDGWERAGLLVLWMTPWFVMQFLTTPISMALHVLGHQRFALLIQVIGLITRPALVYGMYVIDKNYLGEMYAISGLVFYALYFVAILRLSNVHPKLLMKSIANQALPLLCWLTIGITIHIGISMLL